MLWREWLTSLDYDRIYSPFIYFLKGLLSLHLMCPYNPYTHLIVFRDSIWKQAIISWFYCILTFFMSPLWEGGAKRKIQATEIITLKSTHKNQTIFLHMLSPLKFHYVTPIIMCVNFVLHSSNYISLVFLPPNLQQCTPQSGVRCSQLLSVAGMEVNGKWIQFC